MPYWIQTKQNILLRQSSKIHGVLEGRAPHNKNMYSLFWVTLNLLNY